jgi:hypothetical protein
VIIDEFADMMMVVGKKVEQLIRDAFGKITLSKVAFDNFYLYLRQIVFGDFCL